MLLQGMSRKEKKSAKLYVRPFWKKHVDFKTVVVLFSEGKFLISDPISGSGSWEFDAPALFGVQRFSQF